MAAVLSTTVVRAESNHVEYEVPDQQDITVEQHGRRGLVEVTTACLIPGKMSRLAVKVYVPRDNQADLEVRRQGQPDLLAQIRVTVVPSQNLTGTAWVEVIIEVPEDAQAVEGTIRIQEAARGAGNHHGVKLTICVAEAPPTLPPPPVTATPVETEELEEPTPGKTPVSEIGLPVGPTGPEPMATPTSETPPVQLPDTGTGVREASSGTVIIAFAALSILAAFCLPAGTVLWFVRGRRR